MNLNLRAITALICLIAKPVITLSQFQVVPQINPQSYILNTVYNPLKNIIATSEVEESKIDFWDAKSRLKITSLTVHDPVANIIIDSAGKYFVAGTQNGYIYIIDAEKLVIKKVLNAALKSNNGGEVVLKTFPILFLDSGSILFSRVTSKDFDVKSGDIPIQSFTGTIDGFLSYYSITKDSISQILLLPDIKPFGLFCGKRTNEIFLLGKTQLLSVNILTKNIKATVVMDSLNLFTMYKTDLFLIEDKLIIKQQQGDNGLKIYNIKSGKIMMFIDNVFQFGIFEKRKLIIQKTNQKLCQLDINLNMKPLPINSDKIPFCYGIVDLNDNVCGLITQSGIGSYTVNTNDYKPPVNISIEPPFGFSIGLNNCFLYGNGKGLYEFNYQYSRIQRKLYEFNGYVKRIAYIKKNNFILTDVIFYVTDDKGREKIIDSIFALNYTTMQVEWKLGPSDEAYYIDEMKINQDSTKCLLLWNGINIQEVDIENGNIASNATAGNARIFGIDYSIEPTGEYIALAEAGANYGITKFGMDHSLETFYSFTYSWPIRVLRVNHSKKFAVYSFPEDNYFYVLPLTKKSFPKQLSDNARVFSFSSDDKYLAAGSFNKGIVHLYNFISLEKYADIKCGDGKVYDLTFSANDKLLFAVMEDGWISVINIEQRKEIQRILLNNENYLVTDSLGYYSTNKKNIYNLGLRKESRCFPISTADIIYNRPDLLLAQIPEKDTIMLNLYNAAYVKRLKKEGIDISFFKDANLSFPEIQITNAKFISNQTSNHFLHLDIHALSSTPLNNFNTWINDVPLYGASGINVSRQKSHVYDTSINIILSAGINKIEVGTQNIAKINSLRDRIEVTCNSKDPSHIYFIGIGIDSFAQSEHNLHWCTKDIHDLSVKLKEKYGGNINITTLINQNVTLDKVKSLKQKLQHTSVNDKVIVVYSGHGLLSDSFDYYLSMYNVNFKKPEQGGLPYEELENLLDSIPAREKLMLIDACHSGEVDKEEMQRYKVENEERKAKGKGTILINLSKSKIGMTNSFELMQDLFANVGKSTGATIISAAGSTQFAQESGDLKNGVFTYSILEYMKNHLSSTVTELKNYVNKRVPELTKGLQQPTSRTENISVDWRVW